MKDKLLIIKDNIYDWIRLHKEVVVTLILFAGIILFFTLNDFQSEEEYYNQTPNNIMELQSDEEQNSTKTPTTSLESDIVTEQISTTTLSTPGNTNNNLETTESKNNIESQTAIETIVAETTSNYNTQFNQETLHNPQILTTSLAETKTQNLETTIVETTTKKTIQEQTEKKITVYISIDCKTILNQMENLANYDVMKDYIPKDGMLLSKTGYKIDAGSTVFDLLNMVTKANRIQLDYQGDSSSIYNSVYIKGIQYIYEKACGSSSGWMYTVNGDWIGIGCSSKKLSDGDFVQWRFTCDGGSDLKGN